MIKGLHNLQTWIIKGWVRGKQIVPHLNAWAAAFESRQKLLNSWVREFSVNFVWTEWAAEGGEARRRKMDEEEEEKRCKKKKPSNVFKEWWGRREPPSAQLDCLRLFLARPSGREHEVSYHIRTSDVLTHLQGDPVGLLKADAAVDQQERPHKAAGEKKYWRQRHLLVIWRMRWQNSVAASLSSCNLKLLIYTTNYSKHLRI